MRTALGATDRRQSPAALHRGSALVAVSIAAILLPTAGCASHDGRTMRPPAPGQTASVVSTTVDPNLTFPTAATADPNAFLVTGPWQDGTRIASRYTCEDADVSPPLAFDNLPAGTVSLAVTIEDAATTGRYLWVIANIDPAGAYVDEGSVPPGAAEALGSDGTVGYSGPCPAVGTTGTYRVTAYAVSQMLEIEPGDPANLVVQMLRESAVDVALTTFTYSR